MATNDLTAQRLRELLDYEPATGLFRWRARRRKCMPGAIAGNLEPGNRYLRIKVDGRLYYAHRLAWLHVTGGWPARQIDHRNRDKADNRWRNLREATPKQNGENLNARATSSGVLGVNFHPHSGLWRARICHNGQRITLGYFHSIEEAAECRRRAESELFTHSTPRHACPDRGVGHGSAAAARGRP